MGFKDCSTSHTNKIKSATTFPSLTHVHIHADLDIRKEMKIAFNLAIAGYFFSNDYMVKITILHKNNIWGKCGKHTVEEITKSRWVSSSDCIAKIKGHKACNHVFYNTWTYTQHQRKEGAHDALETDITMVNSGEGISQRSKSVTLYILVNVLLHFKNSEYVLFLH